MGDDRPRDRPAGGRLSLPRRARPAAQVLRENQPSRSRTGADILLLEPRRAEGAAFPGSTRTASQVGTWGRSGEGWFDGWALMQAFRKKARSLGVTYVDGEVVERGARGRPGRRGAAGRRHRASPAARWSMRRARPAGGRLAAMAGVDIPVDARKRCVFSFTCRATSRTRPC